MCAPVTSPAHFDKNGQVVAKNERIAELKEALQLRRTETAIEMQYLGKQAKVPFLAVLSPPPSPPCNRRK
jgi:hypothetical protein